MEKLVTSSEAAKILGISLQGIHYRIKKGQLKSLKQDGKIFVYVDQEKFEQTKKESPHSISSSTISRDEALQQFSGYDVLKVKDEQIELLKKTIKFIKRQKDSEIQRLQQQQDKIVNVFQSEVDLLKNAFNEMKSLYQIENNDINSKNNRTTQEKDDDEIVVEDVVYDEDVKTTTTNQENNTSVSESNQVKSVKDKLEAIRKNNMKNNEQQDDVKPSKITEIEELIKVEKPAKEKEVLSLKDFFVLMAKNNKSNSETKLIILDRIKSNDERFEYNQDTQDLIIYKDEFLDLI